MLKLLNPWTILGAVAIVIGAYFLGSSHGYDRGYKNGVEETEDKVKKVEKQITAMKAAEETRKQEVRDRITAITRDAEYAWLMAKDYEDQWIAAKDNIVVQWKTKIVPGQCSVSTSTADMVRAVMSITKEKK